MTELATSFWRKRLEQCADALTANNFTVFIADRLSEAEAIFRKQILKDIKVSSASWGDSMTLKDSGILEFLKSAPEIDFIDTFDPGITREESMELRRRALLVDLFLTGSNAVTEDGCLVNLDMIGNRVGGLTFGPHHVVLVIGRNKIVEDVEAAMERIKRFAAPMNAIRHEGWKTPCVKTSFCMDCQSPQRICNTWTITQKSYPKGRIRVILVNEELGL
ncbi:MAG: lactate utilization protein [Desulfobulbaceae bacterium]|nr:MAG: lactate utilization protein [Desulfobulbaceae bacterium]